MNTAQRSCSSLSAITYHNCNSKNKYKWTFVNYSCGLQNAISLDSCISTEVEPDESCELSV